MGARARFKVQEIDRGWNKLRASLRALKDGASYAKVGVLDDNTKIYENGDFTVAHLAAVHEFGLPERGIPERSFVRAGFEKARPEILALLRQLVPAFYEGKISAEKVLNIVGAKAATSIKSFVTQGPEVPPPNKPATIAAKVRKGAWKAAKRSAGAAADVASSVRTLVDTGRMIGAVTWAVVLRSHGEGDK